MSLTSELKQPLSPVSRYLKAALPLTRQAITNLRTQLAGLEPPVDPRNSGAVSPDYRTLGRVIDHRLRIAVGTPYSEVIAAGVMEVLLPAADMPDRVVCLALHRAGLEMLEELTARTATPAKGEDEERLTRLCYVASAFEDLFRNHMFPARGLLGQATANTTLEQLAALVPSYAVADIAALMELARGPRGFGDFGQMLALPGPERICGPVFAGSPDVGGADADFILNGRLIDSKSTTRPDRIGTPEIYQLAGYLLLDYEDAYRITDVSLYLARQGVHLGWSVADFLRLLGAGRPLAVLRRECRDVLAGAADIPSQVGVGQDSLFDV